LNSGTESRQKKWGLGFAAVVIVAVLGGLLLGLRWREASFQWSEFATMFSRLDWRWIAAATAFGLLTYVGRALRWQILLRPLRRNSSLAKLISATAIGFTAIVLFGRPGELVRPYLISVKEEVPFSSQLAAWFLERIYDLLTALLIFGIALSHVRASGAAVGPGLQWVLQAGGYAAAVVGALCIALLFVFRQFSAQMRQRLLDALSFLPQTYSHKVERVVTAFAQGVESTKSRGSVCLVAFYSMFVWALIVSCYLCALRASPATAGLSLTDVVILVGFVSFGCVVQIPGVGGGMQLVTVIVLTELFGLGLEASTGVAILLWIITVVVVLPIGFLAALQQGLSWGKLRGVGKEAAL